ncbi:MAG: hypothetical protein PF441_05355 [Desulfuromusa sp.]|jgi:predicted nucleic-acid-binding protein|nr:hypothetical protein [Desulfuromusa sp.]
MKHNKRLKSAIIEVVENQIDSNDPPETTQTLNRLISEGFSKNEAKELIGSVVAAEVFEILKNGEKFDKNRYVTALNNLPKIPG